MDSWKQFVKDYLSFSKNERKGVFILLTLIFLAVLVPFVLPWFVRQPMENFSKFEAELSRLKKVPLDSDHAATPYKRYPANEEALVTANPELFYFNPNTASDEEWYRLGLNKKLIHTIRNYVSKGGHFYKAEDIKKIWGLTDSDANRLLQYIRIPEAERPQKPQFAAGTYANNPTPYTAYPRKENAAAIDINKADSNGFVSLPGIGPSYSRRIIAYRNKLGGFYSIDQVAETFGLPDSTFQKIKGKLLVSEAGIKKMNINSVSLDELKAHPYVRYYVANAIIQYRAQHGNFASVEDLKNVMLVTEEIYNKISHYLAVN
jgi:competence protein ComEA